MILTGGGSYPGLLNRVSQYSEDGYLRAFPPLLQGRYGHGCSYFVNEAGVKVDIDSNSCGVIIFQTLLVTGGLDAGNYQTLSSTELLVEKSAKWILTGELPKPRSRLRGANIDQRVMMTGNK